MAAGLIGIAMAYLLEGFEWLFYGVAEGTLPERVEAAPPWRRVLAPALGGAAAGALWWWERASGGVVGVEDAVADGSGTTAARMGLTRPFADGALQVLVVGAGNSVGREGAPRLMAGAVAARLARWLGLEAGTTTLLVAAAAGAGLAAMDNVLKICRALDLTVEELNSIVAKSAPVRTQEEDGIDPHLLELIRRLSLEKQLALKLLLADM